MVRAGSGLRKGLALAAAFAAASAGAPAAWGAEGERAYEMVSPVAKNGYDVSDGTGGPAPSVLSVPDGNRVVYTASGGFEGAAAGLLSTFYVAGRGADWSTTPLDVGQRPFGRLHGRSLYALSEDLSKAVVGSAAALAPGAVEGGANLYVHDRAAGTFALVAGSADPVFVTELFGLGAVPLDAVSPDLDRIVFSTSVDLVPGASPNAPNVYEWTNGQLRLVSRLPDGTTDPVGAIAGSADRFLRAPRPLSSDGSRVFFTTMSYPSKTYLRQDGAETIPVSISRRTGDDPSIARAGQFVGATADGSQAFFVSAEQLTDDSTSAPWGTGELYRYDVATRSVVDLTVATDPADFGGAQVADVPWIAPDGSSAYFVASANLAPGGISGAYNLYRWSADGPIRSVGQLDGWEYTGLRGWAAVSPNGRYFAFRTAGRLTEYDNTTPNPECPDLFGGPGACAQVYRYDAVTGEVICPSCNPSREPPSGPAALGGQGRQSEVAGRFPRAVLDDGSVFLDSPERLVPEDTNDVSDVYVHDGERPRLISTGRGDAPATFADVTLSGRDVFFFTRARLVGRDTDDLVDLYDARVGGGIAAQNPPPEPPPCQGAECRGPLPAPTRPPASPPLATADQTGAGNAQETAPAPPARVRVGRPVASGGRVTVDVTVPARGTVVARGARIVPVRRAIPRAGTYRVRVRLVRRAARTLTRRGRLVAAVRVTFTPRTGAPTSARLTARFRQGRRP